MCIRQEQQAPSLSMPALSKGWIWPLSLALSLMAAAPSPAQSISSRSATAPSTTTFKLAVQSNTIAQMEDQVWQQINEQRQRYGLSPLRLNRQLSLVARSHSQRMARYNFYSHIDPQGHNHRRRVEASGLSAYLIGENLMKCIRSNDPAGLSVSSWMKSPAHRKNVLLPEMKETGVGIWQQGETVYVTQIYMEPK